MECSQQQEMISLWPNGCADYPDVTTVRCIYQNITIKLYDYVNQKNFNKKEMKKENIVEKKGYLPA